MRYCIIIGKSKALMCVCKVFHIGLCETCEQYMRQHDRLPVDLFIAHVRRVLDYIKSRHPGLQAVMWDDMFRGIDLQVLQGQFSATASFCLLGFRDIYDHVGNNIMLLYSC